MEWSVWNVDGYTRINDVGTTLETLLFSALLKSISLHFMCFILLAKFWNLDFFAAIVALKPQNKTKNIAPSIIDFTFKVFFFVLIFVIFKDLIFLSLDFQCFLFFTFVSNTWFLSLIVFFSKYPSFSLFFAKTLLCCCLRPANVSSYSHT